MKRRFFLLGSIVLLTLALLVPLTIVQGGIGVPDGDGHPNVGMMLLEIEGQKYAVCSGSLLSETVFLTAGHCLVFLPSLDNPPLFVTFDSQWTPASAFIPVASYEIHPQFGAGRDNLYDVGVLLLAQQVNDIAPVELPPAGYLDAQAAQGGLRPHSEFVNVGYGVVPDFKQGPPRTSFDGVRRTSSSRFMALDSAWLYLLMNTDAGSEGGSCYGDSGSPKFVPGTNMIVALTTGGDRICRALNYNYRLDTSYSRDFLGQFVSLP